MLLSTAILSVATWADPTLPALSGRIVDAAHVLDRQSIDRMTADLRDFEQRTSTQIVIVTLPDLQDYTIETWGLALLRGWHIGQKDKNNGVVIVLAPNDRQVRIETGYGAEGALPNAAAGEIIREDMKPFFKRGDYAGGLKAGLQRIEAALETTFPAAGGQSIASDTNRQDVWNQVSIPVVIAIISPLLVVLVFYLSIWMQRQEGGRFFSGTASTRRRGYWRNSDTWISESYVDGDSLSSGGGLFSGGGGSGGGSGASGSW